MSVTWQLVDWPAFVCGTTACPLTFDPLIVTLHFTLVSVFWPVLAKFSVNVGAGLAGIAFVEPVCRVVPPTLTEFSAWPCRPGATGCCSRSRAPDAQRVGHVTSVQPCDRGQELAGVDLLAAQPAHRDAGGAQRADDLGHRVVLVEDVGGVEAGHLGRDRVDRSLAGLGLERRLDLSGDVLDPVGRASGARHEVLLGALDLVGNVYPLGLAELEAAWPALR